MTNTPDFLTHALHYASLGWHVFPLVPGGKTPIIPNGHRRATIDTEQITGWWQRWPTANLGIATDPSGLSVYDIDVKNGKLGAQSHAEIVDRLTPTLRASTWSGGEHWYYAAPPGPPLRKVPIRPDGVTAKDPGIDLIGKGYVLAPPSIVAGKPYTWQDTGEIDLAPLPEVLRIAALRPDPAGATIELGELIAEGGRNNELFKIACRLRNAGLGQSELLLALQAINETRVSPPLPPSEVETIAASAGLRAEYATAEVDEKLIGILEKATASPIEIAPTPDGPDDATQISDVLDRMLLSVGALEPMPPIRLHPTGFSELDKLLGGGFATRNLTTVIGGPAAGKTALMTSIARHIVTPRDDYNAPPVLMISTELEFLEVAARFASPLLRIPWRDLVTIDNSNIDIARVTEGFPVYCLDTTRLDMQFEKGLTQIADLTKLIERRHGQPPIVIIDYLQELAANVAADEQRQKTGQVATSLRIISQRIPCAVIAIASVSRSGYGNSLQAIREANDPLGYLALAKESGVIEYTSASLIFVDVEQDATSNDRLGRLVVCKARRGRTGFVGVRFDPALGVYTEEIATGQRMVNRAQVAIEQQKASILQFIAANPGEYDQRKLAGHLKVPSGLLSTMIEAGQIKRLPNRTLATPNVF